MVDSNEHSQHRFLWINWQNYSQIVIKYTPLLTFLIFWVVITQNNLRCQVNFSSNFIKYLEAFICVKLYIPTTYKGVFQIRPIKKELDLQIPPQEPTCK